MYHKIRQSHKLAGIIFSLCFLLLAVTGLLLAMKDSLGFVRPPEAKAEKILSMSDVVSVERVVEAAVAVGLPELKSFKDIDRIDYRPNKNLFKVLSKEGYHEVQVDGKSGMVIGTAKRNDQLIEDIHDLTFFSDLLRKYGLPVVALGLAGMSITGIWIYVVPVLRRRKFKAQK
jgi:uncharacterized iron-regulated membrane protein